jgi:hypothetical protein
MIIALGVNELIWKRFNQAHKAGRYFNQANEYWSQAKQYVLNDKLKHANESLIEVVRLCQLAIESDKRIGNAYILLANALMNLARQIPEQEKPVLHDYLLSRAAAVIHLWHSLPYRNYPISKNAGIGEQIWIATVKEISNSKSLSEAAAISLLDSFIDSLATEAISPESFDMIKSAFPKDTPENQILLKKSSEEKLTPETRNFLISILPTVMQRRMESKNNPTTNSFSEESEKLIDSLNCEGKIQLAYLEFIDLIFDGLQNKNCREVVGWLGWLYQLILFQDMIQLGSDVEVKSLAMETKLLGDSLATAIHDAKKENDWNGLLFSIGLYDLVSVTTKGDEVFQYLCEVNSHHTALKLAWCSSSQVGH